jgi:hypothetical protein
MKTNRWIELSQRFYRQLLRLYPQAYRTTYEAEMFRFFTSQCREAYQQRGAIGILLLWLGTFVDVGKTVMVEHISDPNAKAGLLEAVPNAPLPWKGVFLVLIPGLVFFISQIVQVTSDKDWFFIAYYYAAFLLIVPVLFTWSFKRRFPVWGLIPLGLLYAILQSFPPDDLIGKLPFTVHFKPVWIIEGVALNPYYVLVESVVLILLCGFIGYGIYKRQFSNSVWFWLAIYGALIICRIAGEFQPIIDEHIPRQNLSWLEIIRMTNMRQYLAQLSLWDLYDPLAFLLLIFLGKLFVRRHRGFTFLLLLGYLLPAIVYGRYGEWSDAVPFSIVVMIVLLYRFIVALVAPVWLVRAMPALGQQRAALIPVAIATLCSIAFNLILNSVMVKQYAYQVGLFDYILSIWNQLIVVVGLGLAMVLYFPSRKEDDVPPPLVAVTE